MMLISAIGVGLMVWLMWPDIKAKLKSVKMLGGGA